VRSIVEIDRELCDGCSVCLHVCAEAALELDEEGKARLVGDALCDGLGACLDVCPTGALKVVRREAGDFDEAAVHERIGILGTHRPAHEPHPPAQPVSHGHGCPGSAERQFLPAAASETASPAAATELSQWPIQLHLVSPEAQRFRDAHLLVAADCTAFAMADFNQACLPGKKLVIACPKLDSNQEVYLARLTALIDEAQVNSITVMIMEVPCCGGLLRTARMAAERAGREVPIKAVVVGVDGAVRREEWVA